jgi:hypothetical protein
MKKILAIILILAVAGVCGCATLKNFFCSPTAEQVMAAGEKLSQATAMLAFLESLAPVPEITAAIAALQIAIPILRQIKDGICVDAADAANAERAVSATQPLGLKLGFKKP